MECFMKFTIEFSLVPNQAITHPVQTVRLEPAPSRSDQRVSQGGALELLGHDWAVDEPRHTSPGSAAVQIPSGGGDARHS